MTEDKWHRRSIVLRQGAHPGVGDHESANITFPDPPSGHEGAALRITQLSGTDYDYHLTIPAENKDWLLLNLLHECWDRVGSTTEHFRNWLDAREIGFEDFGYWSGPSD